MTDITTTRSDDTRRRRRRLAAALISSLAVLAGLLPAGASAADPGSQTVVFPDGQWRAILDTTTTNLIVYKKITASATLEHREWLCSGLFCWGGHKWQWVERPAHLLYISQRYDPTDPPPGPCPPYNCPPPAPPRTCQAVNQASLDCSDFVVGVGGLNIKTIHASAQVVRPDGQSVRLGPVEDSFAF